MSSRIRDFGPTQTTLCLNEYGNRFLLYRDSGQKFVIGLQSTDGTGFFSFIFKTRPNGQ